MCRRDDAVLYLEPVAGVSLWLQKDLEAVHTLLRYNRIGNDTPMKRMIESN